MINKRNAAWSDRIRRKEMAEDHVKFIHDNYYELTSESVKNTIKHESFKINDNEWSDDFTLNSTVVPIYQELTKVSVSTRNTVEAIIHHYKNKKKNDKYRTIKMAALNFSSFTSPGGKFLEGSIAQEEYLCHDSNLYNILIQFDKTFYENNRKCKNNSLFHNNSLYIPDVVFMDKTDIKAKCDIITCAAPNTYAAMKYKNISYEECLKAMINRIDHVLNVAYKQHVTHLILGAYGCGVFGNNPTDTAAVFMTLLTSKYRNVFNTVEFAIPIGINNDNNEKFINVMRTFEAFGYSCTKALSHFDLVKELIGEKPWLI